jgi:uncharacterized Zn finger protein
MARSSYSSYYNERFPPYVSVAQRRKDAEKHAASLQKKGKATAPVRIEGKKIANTFWGKAWCDHLESHSDYANRLPRGRSYVKNGAVIDLQIGQGKVTAVVVGSDVYTVTISITKLGAPRWRAIAAACTGQIGSLVELLQGKLSSAVMEVITHRSSGLFPTPRQITLDCTCPDSAWMCKHVAAALYGVGARLDDQPELLFTLRGVDHGELVQAAVSAPAKKRATGRVLSEDTLSDIFGIDLAPTPPATKTRTGSAKRRAAKE